MTHDPRRWSESDADAPDILRNALLRERQERADDRARVDRVALRLGALLIPPGTPGGPSGGGNPGPPAPSPGPSAPPAPVVVQASKIALTSAPKVFLSKIVASKVVSVGMAILAGGTLVTVITTRGAPEETPSNAASSSASVAVMSAPVASVVTAIDTAPRVVVVASASASAVAPSVVPSSGALSQANAASSKPVVSTLSLAEEARALEKAQDLLKEDPSAALAAAENHARSQPSGELAQEREVVAIEALVQLGRLDEAKGRAAAFSVKYPGNSAHVVRIRRAIDSASKAVEKKVP